MLQEPVIGRLLFEYSKYSQNYSCYALLNTCRRFDTLRIGEREKADMTMTDYRKRAEECIEIAQTTRSPAQRTMLLHIAETWMNLARDAEGNSSSIVARDARATTNLN
jgi:hypothetical protein